MSEITIMIPTLESRKLMLRRLLDCLAPQLSDKICININQNNGSRSIGHYRNELLKSVKTPYCVFIDDDDVVSPEYIESHLKAIESQPDAVGFHGEITTNGTHPTIFEHRFGNNWENYRMQYLRPISHINLIKTEIAQQIGYNDLGFAEDSDFSKRLAESGLIKSAEFINQTMYYYLYNSKK